ncbi:MAG: EamA family transporter, partial [Candidatus Krumholzibacteria bacterium]|nr:EamA family transporter [Candidatus Krumholzibacteria bacterium]
HPGTATLALGLAAGVIYVLGFLLLMAGIARLPLAVPVTIARLSVALPVIVAVLFWSEKPGILQWLGLFLGLMAILIFGMSFTGPGCGSGGRGRAVLIVPALFVVLGLGDIALKAFRETASDLDRLAFTWILFTAAAVLAWILIAMRRVRFDARTFALGLLLGLPNLFSTVFTLLALRAVPASIAFPFINLAVIVGSTLAGFVLWKERLRGMTVAGLVVAGGAILLLALR